MESFGSPKPKPRGEYRGGEIMASKLDPRKERKEDYLEDLRLNSAEHRSKAIKAKEKGEALEKQRIAEGWVWKWVDSKTRVLTKPITDEDSKHNSKKSQK